MSWVVLKRSKTEYGAIPLLMTEPTREAIQEVEAGGQEYWETNEWFADRVCEHITKYIGEVFKESCGEGTEPRRRRWRKWVRKHEGCHSTK